jgi:hypothetical protein
MIQFRWHDLFTLSKEIYVYLQQRKMNFIFIYSKRDFWIFVKITADRKKIEKLCWQVTNFFFEHKKVVSTKLYH